MHDQISPQRFMVAALCLLLASPVAAKDDTQDDAMVKIKGGVYQLPFLGKDTPALTIADFWLDRHLVTNAEFAQFVQSHPKWQRHHIASAFSYPAYLDHWHKNAQGEDTYRPEDANKPVTHVSWFAAHAYCQAQKKRLPTIAQWEYAARYRGANNATAKKTYQDRLMQRYYMIGSAPLAEVMQGTASADGVYDMDMLWEWTEDFNMATLHAGNAADAICSIDISAMAEPSNYSAFTRQMQRAHIYAKEPRPTVGFRCARAITS